MAAQEFLPKVGGHEEPVAALGSGLYHKYNNPYVRGLYGGNTKRAIRGAGWFDILRPIVKLAAGAGAKLVSSGAAKAVASVGADLAKSAAVGAAQTVGQHIANEALPSGGGLAMTNKSKRKLGMESGARKRARPFSRPF